MAMLIPLKGGSDDISKVAMIDLEKSVKVELHQQLTMNYGTYIKTLHDLASTGTYKGKEVSPTLVMSTIDKLLSIHQRLSDDVELQIKADREPKDVVDALPDDKIPLPKDVKEAKQLTNKKYDQGLPEDTTVSTYYMAQQKGVTPEFLYPLRLKLAAGEISHLEMNKLIKAEKDTIENGGNE